MKLIHVSRANSLLREQKYVRLTDSSHSELKNELEFLSYSKRKVNLKPKT